VLGIEKTVGGKGFQPLSGNSNNCALLYNLDGQIRFQTSAAFSETALGL